jgi:hypothetical protein
VTVVTEVVASQLDPSWLGQLFEVVEESRDGEVRHGFRLRGYMIPADGPVRLVTQWSTIPVDPGAVLRCFAAAAVPDRWTGALPSGQVPQPGWAPPGGAPPPPGAYPAPPVPHAGVPAPVAPVAPVAQGQPVRPGPLPGRPAPWAQPGAAQAGSSGGWPQTGA